MVIDRLVCRGFFDRYRKVYRNPICTFTPFLFLQKVMEDEEIMKYGVLGEDAATTPEKLEKYTGEIAWSYLKPHFDSGALLFVDPALELTEVGIALTNDQVEKVDAWKKAGDILTPSQPHADFWEESDQHFKALVVSPFVLAQPTVAPPTGGAKTTD